MYETTYLYTHCKHKFILCENYIFKNSATMVKKMFDEMVTDCISHDWKIIIVICFPSVFYLNMNCFCPTYIRCVINSKQFDS